MGKKSIKLPYKALNYGNYGVILIMGIAGCISSAVYPLYTTKGQLSMWLIPYPVLGYLLFFRTGPNHKTRSPRKGVGYKPLYSQFHWDTGQLSFCLLYVQGVEVGDALSSRFALSEHVFGLCSTLSLLKRLLYCVTVVPVRTTLELPVSVFCVSRI